MGKAITNSLTSIALTTAVMFVISLGVHLVSLVVWDKLWPTVSDVPTLLIPLLGFGFIVWKHRLSIGAAVLTGIVFWVFFIPLTFWLGLIVTGGDGP